MVHVIKIYEDIIHVRHDLFVYIRHFALNQSLIVGSLVTV